MARDFAKPFYNSRAWQAVREYCMQRDHFACVRCGALAEEVHHIIRLSAKNIGDPKITLNPDNLICLCKTCHFAEHTADKAQGHRTRQECNDEYEFDENGFLVPARPPIDQNL